MPQQICENMVCVFTGKYADLRRPRGRNLDWDTRNEKVWPC